MSLDMLYVYFIAYNSWMKVLFAVLEHRTCSRTTQKKVLIHYHIFKYFLEAGNSEGNQNNSSTHQNRL